MYQGPWSKLGTFLLELFPLTDFNCGLVCRNFFCLSPLTSDIVQVQWCFPSTEAIRTIIIIRDGESQDGHFDFHTVPELWDRVIKFCWPLSKLGTFLLVLFLEAGLLLPWRSSSLSFCLSLLRWSQAPESPTATSSLPPCPWPPGWGRPPDPSPLPYSKSELEKGTVGVLDELENTDSNTLKNTGKGLRLYWMYWKTQAMMSGVKLDALKNVDNDAKG